MCIRDRIKAMGIQGLLRALKSIQTHRHIRDYRGQRAAIDAYGWLHKGSYSCAYELTKHIPTTKYFPAHSRHIDYCLRRVDMLVRAGIIPVVVFDGGKLPMKCNVERARDKVRSQNKTEGDRLWKSGQADLAVRKYSEAIDITYEIAYELMVALRRRCIEYVVAPYEADAQMAYLYRTKYVSLVITEDSDLLAYGCDKVLFKLDGEGYGEEIDLANLEKAIELDFTGFSKDMLLQMCILSGCDYLNPVKGISFKRAHDYIAKYKTIDEVLNVITKEGKTPLPPNYGEDFEKAFLTFKFQTVFSPNRKELCHLNDFKSKKYASIRRYRDKSFLGVVYERAIGVKIAEGEIDPISYQELPKQEQDLVKWACTWGAGEKTKTKKEVKKRFKLTLAGRRHSAETSDDSKETCKQTCIAAEIIS
eukprot:TRINITY_DN7874_c0_g3_i1.p1 TRINITY_DN7874_c0_g3~~TRINITY_DN7874_c0_g3_i1.p1  ORF type:complete len:434 (+),score=129.23 TRINITY_DN7874_c0_g3_i1:48-1304(+)